MIKKHIKLDLKWHCFRPIWFGDNENMSIWMEGSKHHPARASNSAMHWTIMSRKDALIDIINIFIHTTPLRDKWMDAATNRETLSTTETINVSFRPVPAVPPSFGLVRQLQIFPVKRSAKGNAKVRDLSSMRCKLSSKSCESRTKRHRIQTLAAKSTVRINGSSFYHLLGKALPLPFARIWGRGWLLPWSTGNLHIFLISLLFRHLIFRAALGTPFPFLDLRGILFSTTSIWRDISIRSLRFVCFLLRIWRSKCWAVQTASMTRT